jgi:signal transduction histidine kinase/DNA-binding NarL/FixJ family response regulator
MERKASVLLVDDRPEKLLSIETLLEDMPVEVISAGSGREALRQLLQRDFALILLDVNMPGMDGFETATLIRGRKQSEHIPIIFLTAYGDEIFMERGYSLGAVDYILQPVVPEVLRAKVSVFVELFHKNAQLQRYADLQRQRVGQLQKLAAAAVAVNSASSVHGMLDIVTETARSLIDAHQAITLHILEGARGPDQPSRTENVAYFSDKYARWRTEKLQLDQCADTVIGRSTTAVRLTHEEFLRHPDYAYVSSLHIPPVRGVLAAPLLGHNNRRIGILYLSDKESGDFTVVDEAIIVQLAQMASIALENAISFEARDANRAKDQFLAVLSHELRTPLTPVLAALSEIGADRRIPEDIQADLEMVRRNVELEARLIDDLLDLTRISKGKVELRLGPADAHSLLADAVDICQGDIAAKELVVRRQLGARKHFVLGDAARLHQVFWNLMKNAVKFTPPGGIIDLESDNSTEGELMVRIRDTGIGIEAEMLPRIFNAFEQGERFITRQFGGLGLGLTITKALVDAHHGTITAVSGGRSQGSVFTLNLPLAQPAAHPGVSDAPQAQPPCTRSLKILLVEDHPDTGRIMARLLANHKHKVKLAQNVADALRHYDDEHFDLVISDIGLPDGSGIDLMRELQARRPVPAIALSGFGMEEDLRRSREAGFQAHLIKPVDFPKLLDCIERMSWVREPTVQGQPSAASPP